MGLCKANAAERAKPPRVARRRVQAPSVDLVRDVIEEAEKRDPKPAPLLMLAALTGMRRGLGAGDEGSRSVVVGGVVEGTAKTDRSRTVVFDAVGIALMQRYQEQVFMWVKKAGGESFPADAFAFSPAVDSLLSFRPDSVMSFFIRVCTVVGAPNGRLHDLRHFTATQLIGADVDVCTFAGRLFHSDSPFTLRNYSHAHEERDRAAATIMGKALSAKRKKPALLPTAG